MQVMETPRYNALSKALLKELSTDIRSLAHKRLADQLRFIQKHKMMDDTQIANAMNACKAVIGNRAQGERAFAPISQKKITRFKDQKTRPQTKTLEQMTAFFEDVCDMPRILAWADFDDVLAGYYEARRFRKARTRKNMIEMISGWLFITLLEPSMIMAVQLTPLNSHPVIMARGRVIIRIENDDNPETIERFLYGYATVTPWALTINMRGDCGKQYSIHADILVGQLDDDPDDEEPYLAFQQVRINLPPEFKTSFHPIFPAEREIRSRLDYGLFITEQNVSDPNGPMFSTCFHLSERDLTDKTAKGKFINLPMDKFGLLVAEQHKDQDDLEIARSVFGKQVDDLRYFLQAQENKRRGAF